MAAEPPDFLRGRSERRDRVRTAVGPVALVVFILLGIVLGFVRWSDALGIGLVYALGVGLICLTTSGGRGPRFGDPTNVRNHWRGHLQAAAAIAFGGAALAALVR